ncbi:MAG TPA: DUF4406 domain-containing protein [Pedobacter sp.]|jgi:nucleoside 2-deoxyribosyltransferase
MENPKIYIAGKVSGLADHNAPKFEAATRELRSRGYIVRSPHEICTGIEPEKWEDCMKQCIKVMLECDLILMLDDWYDSRGSKIEYGLAKELCMPTEMYDTFINRLNLKPIA